jgi:hypothetical protein
MTPTPVSNFRFDPEEKQRWQLCAELDGSGSLTAWLQGLARRRAAEIGLRRIAAIESHRYGSLNNPSTRKEQK